jgi:hypothetical protein
LSLEEQLAISAVNVKIPNNFTVDFWLLNKIFFYFLQRWDKYFFLVLSKRKCLITKSYFNINLMLNPYGFTGFGCFSFREG